MESVLREEKESMVRMICGKDRFKLRVKERELWMIERGCNRGSRNDGSRRRKKKVRGRMRLIE